VRPILNLKHAEEVAKMRAIAEEAVALVRAFKGSHSGEHGDGLVRSELHEVAFGPRLVRAFEAVKDAFDPAGVLNPGKIVRAPRMDERRLLRYPPGYQAAALEPALDWQAWGGFLGAAEMCNNNGACRKAEPGVMCPSYRVTQDETHVTRGRANSLRLALSGQLGPEALTSEAMAATLDLCVSCKACRRECPTGVDMARMKIEVLHQRRKRHGLKLGDRLIGYLPRYARHASRLRWVLNLRDRVAPLAALSESMLGLSGRRSLPRWHGRPYREPANRAPPIGDGREVALLVDTFTRWFEPEIAHAAEAVLAAAGYRVHLPAAAGARPLCCGRTFLAVGLVEEARAEAKRLLGALAPLIQRGLPVIGLEPSCLLSLRDEYQVLLPGPEAAAAAGSALLLEEFLAREQAAGRLELRLKASPWRRALLHGHCHQKAFDALAASEACLSLVPDLTSATIESSCCGMAGAFGYQARHQAISMQMAEVSLLPAVRAADAGTIVVADGTSCRHQIRDGSGRRALHVAQVLQAALP
jgi:Fe-S oxidoreductase